VHGLPTEIAIGAAEVKHCPIFQAANCAGDKLSKELSAKVCPFNVSLTPWVYYRAIWKLVSSVPICFVIWRPIHRRTLREFALDW